MTLDNRDFNITYIYISLIIYKHNILNIWYKDHFCLSFTYTKPNTPPKYMHTAL